MKKYLVAAACLTLVAGVVYAKKMNKEQKRLEECGVVMQEVLNIPDNIPLELLEKAECVIVIPSVQILSSFCNGELYKIALTYDRASTEGLTALDMMNAISASYGPATNVAPEVDSAKIESYEVKQKLVATWEDSQYSLNLVRSSFTDGFGLVIYSKRANAEAELAIAEAVKLDKQEGPQREAERQKKETKDLEAVRQKNRKIFRP